MQPERRCYPRKKLEASVDYSSENKADAKDISTGGICIVTEDVMSKGTVLFLVIPINSNGAVHAIGEVIWSKKVSEKRFEIGIEFLSLNDVSKQKISFYVNRK